MIGQPAREVKSNTLLAVALKIDRLASEDEYYITRHLKANADLYGSFVYTALYDVLTFKSEDVAFASTVTDLIYQNRGFEPNIVTCLAAVARISGWMAHWREAMRELFSACQRDVVTKDSLPHPEQPPPIWRPQQIFVGKATERPSDAESEKAMLSKR